MYENYVKDKWNEKAKNSPFYEEAKNRWLNGESMTSICKDMHFDRHTLSAYLRSDGYDSSARNKTYSYKKDCFKKINTKEKAYWLGFLYADGYIRAYDMWNCHLTLGVKDNMELKKFAKLVSNDLPVHYEDTKLGGKDFQVARVSITCKEIVEDLIKLGCVPNKGNNIVWPTVEQVPSRFEIDFLRGFFDGDGSVACNGRRLTLSLNCASEEFAESFVECLIQRDICVNIKCVLMNKWFLEHKPNRVPLYGFQTSRSSNLISFFEKVYKKNKDYCLKRKYDRLLEYCRLRTKSQKS